MKVTVFGGTGFVGRYLIDALIKSGMHPTVLVRAGIEDAEEELIEIVDFLKNPKKYTSLGGRIKKNRGDALQLAHYRRMLESLGLDYVLLGHSERRALFGETEVLASLPALEFATTLESSFLLTIPSRVFRKLVRTQRDGRREGSFSDCLDSITSRSL